MDNNVYNSFNFYNIYYIDDDKKKHIVYNASKEEYDFIRDRYKDNRVELLKNVPLV